ncbi:MAG: precorrin-6y C5,15-methyltransferase (decarboxylating) subunit CbiE [Thermogutta sp.]
MATKGDAPQRIHIIGIGEDGLAGLTEQARQLVTSADLLIGDPDCLAVVRDIPVPKLETSSSLQEIVAQIAAHPEKKIVFLAEGDPLFYGVARYLWEKFGKDRFEVVPHVSSMQLAFARVKENWEDAYLANLADHPLEEVLSRIRSADKVGLFTTEELPPNRVAEQLLTCGLDYFSAYVCEHLGAPNERVTAGELQDIAKHAYSPLNVMILVRKPDVPDRPLKQWGKRLFGNPDETFLQSKPKRGLLTPAEIRAIALAKLDVGSRSVVWDIGAGSGSLSIEAAQIAREGTVFAVEMDADDYALLCENATRFDVANLKPILGRAPEAWTELPDPDCVFVGGSGRQVVDLCQAAFSRLRPGGRLVVTMGSVDNVAECQKRMRNWTPHIEVLMINLARGYYQLDRVRFQALNPTFIVAAVKPLAENRSKSG